MRLSGLFTHSVLPGADGLCVRPCRRTQSGTESGPRHPRQATGQEVTVTGCLTAAPDRAAFVVTADRNALMSGAMHSGSGEVPTYAYELVDSSADLSPHVGGRSKSRASRSPIATKKWTSMPGQDQGAADESGRDTVTPAVETKPEIEIKVEAAARRVGDADRAALFAVAASAWRISL